MVADALKLSGGSCRASTLPRGDHQGRLGWTYRVVLFVLIVDGLTALAQVRARPLTPTDKSQRPTSQTSESKAGSILSFSVVPCVDEEQHGEQYVCFYSYGAKVRLTGKNLKAIKVKSETTGARVPDEVFGVGDMTKVDASSAGDRWELSLRTGIGGLVWAEARDARGETIKSSILSLAYESASSITIVSPRRNEEFRRGSPAAIRWVVLNPPKGSWIRIDISKIPEAGHPLPVKEAIVVQKDVPSKSSFTWNIPSDLEPRRYEIRLDLYGERAKGDSWITRSFTDFAVK